MPVDHGHAKAHCGYRKIRLLDTALGKNTKYLLRLGLDLWLLTGDIRDDVVEDIHRRNAGITRTRDRLHRRQNARLDAKFAMQSSERRCKADHGAVRIRDDKAFRESPLFTLTLDEADVVAIDLGNDERHILIHPVTRRIRYHRITSSRKSLLGFAGDVRREARKNELAIERRLDG